MEGKSQKSYGGRVVLVQHLHRELLLHAVEVVVRGDDGQGQGGGLLEVHPHLADQLGRAVVVHVALQNNAVVVVVVMLKLMMMMLVIV